MLGCKVDGCERRHDAKGYCNRHYAKWRRHRDPLHGVTIDPDMCPQGHLKADNRRPGRYDCAVCHRDREREERRANPEADRARARKYQRANREANAARAKAWAAANPERVRQHSAENSALRKHGRDRETVEFTKVLRADPCAYCGGPGGTVDHIQPVRAPWPARAHRNLDDLNRWPNLTGACKSCNQSKRTRDLLGYLMYRGGIGA